MLFIGLKLDFVSVLQTQNFAIVYTDLSLSYKFGMYLPPVLKKTTFSELMSDYASHTIMFLQVGSWLRTRNKTFAVLPLDTLFSECVYGGGGVDDPSMLGASRAIGVSKKAGQATKSGQVK